MAAKNLKSVSLNLQGMEERAVPASLSNGILYVVGTPHNDVVDVRRVTTDTSDVIQVTMNGHVSNWTPSKVHLIKFWGLDGHDNFVYQGGKDVIADGGAGNDTIQTGGGNDKLYGGSGRDVLVAGAGNDLLKGGSGNDWLEGGAGNDHLYGEDGNDVLDGQSGNDSINGGAGKDVAFGGSGNDEFWGVANNTGGLSAPVTTPDGTAYTYGIQDASSGDYIWS